MEPMGTYFGLLRALGYATGHHRRGGRETWLRERREGIHVASASHMSNIQ